MKKPDPPLPADFWSTKPYSIPLNRIRLMMTNLDKDLQELYKKKSLQFSSSSSSAAKSISAPVQNIKKSPSKIGSNKISNFSLNNAEYSSPFTFEQYKHYKDLAQRANKNRKIFTIYGYAPTIKQALRRREWVEKLPIGSHKVLQELSHHNLLQNAKKGNDYETVMISKLLKNSPPYFIWQPKGLRDHFNYALPYRNRVRRGRAFDFTTKDGLMTCTENAHFYTADGVAGVVAPRCYRLAIKDEVMNFLHDYRITYCISMLLYIDKNMVTASISDEKGKIPLSVTDFAIARINEKIQRCNNEDLDVALENEPKISSEEWKSFMINANKLIKGEEKLEGSSAEISAKLDKIKKSLQGASSFYPRMETEGYNNVWILKPSAFCRGNGIVLFRDYDSIMAFLEKRPTMRYIVQKYIEYPLLIYKTKFDIRQYILLTIDEYVNIWMYKDCYLKFSSHEYNLKDFRQSIHLTNNSVSKKYKNGVRSDKLPPHNMWSLSQFQEYLKTIGKEDIWQTKVFPEMKQNVISIVLASLEETELVVNSFELYGCDFMLDENFNCLLIEINATPDMSPSTCVTAKLCPAALEDMIKVVVDRPKDTKASTGKFELIYRIPCARVPSYTAGLTVMGTNMKVLTPENLPAKKKSVKIITENDLKDVKGNYPNDLEMVQHVTIDKFFKMAPIQAAAKRRIIKSQPKKLNRKENPYNQNILKIIPAKIQRNVHPKPLWRHNLHSRLLINKLVGNGSNKKSKLFTRPMSSLAPETTNSVLEDFLSILYRKTGSVLQNKT